MPQCSVAEIERKQQYLKDLFRDKHIKYAYHDAKTGYLEAVLARGDRQLGKVILKAWKKDVHTIVGRNFSIMISG